VAAIIIFYLLDLLPGDPAQFILGINATPESVARLRVQMGLDVPAPERFVAWIWGMLQDGSVAKAGLGDRAPGSAKMVGRARKAPVVRARSPSDRRLKIGGMGLPRACQRAVWVANKQTPTRLDAGWALDYVGRANTVLLRAWKCVRP
jgi:hypothetical protein